MVTLPPPSEPPAPLRAWRTLLRPKNWRSLLQNLWFYRRFTSLGGPVDFPGGIWPEIANDGELHVGKGLKILSNIHKSSIGVFPGATLRIGQNVTINNGFIVSARVGVTIGDGVGIGYHVLIMDSDSHGVVPSEETRTSHITIGKHVWLASKSTVLKGVTIGDYAVVATGAVVVKDVPAYAVVAGVPAQVVRMIDPATIDWRFHNPDLFDPGRG